MLCGGDVSQIKMQLCEGVLRVKGASKACLNEFDKVQLVCFVCRREATKTKEFISSEGSRFIGAF